jgi:hypothetical protein
MRRFFLLGLCSMTMIHASAQDYQNICTPGTTFYKSAAGSYQAFRRDSILLPGNNDTVFFSYPAILNASMYDCGDTTNGSILGRKIYKKSNGWFYFFNENNDTIKINSQAGLNEVWRFCALTGNNYIQAKVTSLITATVLNTTDPVKIITLQAKDDSNNNLPHILNGKSIQLSQHYGLNTMLFIYSVPTDTTLYTLDGKTNPLLGNQDLTWQNVYDFQVGDVFHRTYTHWYHGVPGVDTSHSFKEIKTVVGKTVSVTNDTITYAFNRYQSDVKIVWNIFTWTYDTSTWTSQNIIYETYVFSALSSQASFTRLPSEFLRKPPYSYQVFADGFASYIDFIHHRTKVITDLKYKYSYDKNCWLENYTGSPGSGPNASVQHNYSQGLGETLYYTSNGEYHNNYYTVDSLVYFKKGGESWGTPIAMDCSVLEGASLIIVVPNPVITKAEIRIRGHQPGTVARLILYDNFGNKIFETSSNTGIFNFSREGIPAGLYLMAVYDADGRFMSSQKMIVQ